VCRFNRFVLFSWQPDEAAPIYRYALCHRCGLVYATRRPAGKRYEWLMEHFEETLGRHGNEGGRISHTSRRLTDQERERLKGLISRGVYVSDHLELRRSHYLPALLSDRLASSAHVEMLSALVPMRKARVLEVRSKMGSISDALRRLFDADVHAMALFENQQFLIDQTYGIPVVSGIDFDRFSVPFEGEFDVIIANHMLTHAVRPGDFLRTVRDRLRPGGYLYLYSEMDEGDYLNSSKSIFSMNPFHLQSFNRRALVRVLAAGGFATTFITLFRGSYVCVARRDEGAAASWEPMSDKERGRRRRAYRTAVTKAVLTMPPHARKWVKNWDQALEAALAAGAAELTKQGIVKLKRAHDRG
jgi:SAM-dependent methyltransferase